MPRNDENFAKEEVVTCLGTSTSTSKVHSAGASMSEEDVLEC